MACNPNKVARRQLPARAGAPSGHPQAGRWDARVGNTDRGGQIDPAGAAASGCKPLIDPTFSEHSHGFRAGRSAHGAVLEAQRYVQAGYRTVVDVDLERFFDRVNHDILMDRLVKRVADKRASGCCKGCAAAMRSWG